VDESSRIEGLLGEQRESVDGEAPIGADAVALAVAMDTAKHDPALARKAGNCVFRARKAIVSRQAGPWFHAMPVQCS
jgi:hypothetical protein